MMFLRRIYHRLFAVRLARLEERLRAAEMAKAAAEGWRARGVSEIAEEFDALAWRIRWGR